MLATVSKRLADVAQRVVPDPFVIAIGLTLVAALLGLLLMPEPDLGVLADGWYARLVAPGTLTFTYQMALMLVAGTTLARAPLVERALARLARVPTTTRAAAALTGLVAIAGSLLNWGFGLVAGAVLAREIGRRAQQDGRPLDYPLVAAAGYTGLMVWHGGFSGSAPLKVQAGGPPVGAPIPLEQTILSPLNLALSAALLVVVPWGLWHMAGTARERAVVVPAREPLAGEPERHPVAGAVLALVVIVLGALALSRVFARDGVLGGLGIDVVNLLLVLAGLILFGTPLRYGRAFLASVGEAGGILLQFPFYFGILGLLEAAGGVSWLAERSVEASRALAALGLPLGFAFDMVTFLSAGLVNLFVPSGGGQWAVQGTILVEAAQRLELPISRAVMALAYGDEWTNMLQPFWALALLGITGLRARDILGYTLTVMLLAFPLYALAFALF